MRRLSWKTVQIHIGPDQGEKMKRLLSALFFSALAAGAAENLVFNSGFEMGTDGFAIVRIL